MEKSGFMELRQLDLEILPIDFAGVSKILVFAMNYGPPVSAGVGFNGGLPEPMTLCFFNLPGIKPLYRFQKHAIITEC